VGVGGVRIGAQDERAAQMVRAVSQEPGQATCHVRFAVATDVVQSASACSQQLLPAVDEALIRQLALGCCAPPPSDDADDALAGPPSCRSSFGLRAVFSPRSPPSDLHTHPAHSLPTLYPTPHSPSHAMSVLCNAVARPATRLAAGRPVARPIAASAAPVRPPSHLFFSLRTAELTLTSCSRLHSAYGPALDPVVRC